MAFSILMSYINQRKFFIILHVGILYLFHYNHCVFIVQAMQLVDDTPSQCEADSIPPLPTLPPLVLSDIPSHLHSTVLFIAEFLYNFSEPLELKKVISLPNLCQLFGKKHGLSYIYSGLLKVFRNIV